MEKYWTCIIGPIDDSKIPKGGDFPPRIAARNAILAMTGVDPPCESGWGETPENLARRILRRARKKEIER